MEVPVRGRRPKQTVRQGSTYREGVLVVVLVLPDVRTCLPFRRGPSTRGQVGVAATGLGLNGGCSGIVIGGQLAHGPTVIQFGNCPTRWQHDLGGWRLAFGLPGGTYLSC